jgi:hypothetical protein
MNRMAFQYDYLGGSVPQNLGLLVCGTCTDALNFQQKLLILPPDPRPIFNTRPESYAVDETNWLTTDTEDVITTESGDPLITSIPNPDTETVAGSTPEVDEAAVNITTEDGDILVTEQGDGNPLNVEPNPPAPFE